jgi:hypothetical protein
MPFTFLDVQRTLQHSADLTSTRYTLSSSELTTTLANTPHPHPLIPFLVSTYSSLKTTLSQKYDEYKVRREERMERYKIWEEARKEREEKEEVIRREKQLKGQAMREAFAIEAHTFIAASSEVATDQRIQKLFQTKEDQIRDQMVFATCASAMVGSVLTAVYKNWGLRAGLEVAMKGYMAELGKLVVETGAGMGGGGDVQSVQRRVGFFEGLLAVVSLGRAKW